MHKNYISSPACGLVILLFPLLLNCKKETISSPTKNCATPIANAGQDQFNVVGETNIAANYLDTGEKAKWQIVSGTGGIISDITKPFSKFSGTPGQNYTLCWTVSNSCNKTSSDTVLIGFGCVSPISNAGPDQLYREGISTTLAANYPTINEYGRWTIVRGIGGHIADSSISNSTFTGYADHSYTLTWTIFNNCNETSVDSIIVGFKKKFVYGSLSDIEGNTYKTIKIGSQTWMAENLRTTKYNDGNSIELVSDNSNWANLGHGAYCWYNNDISNKLPYGALYNWYTIQTGKISPVGWHIPTEAEWLTLVLFADSNAMDKYPESQIAGDKLKATSGWYDECNRGSDEYGFAGLGGGYRNGNSYETTEFLGIFIDKDLGGLWWSESVFPGAGARGFNIYACESDMVSNYHSFCYGLSIRCIKD